MSFSLLPLQQEASLLLSVLDLTNLNEDDGAQKIEELCELALYSPVLPKAICIYPEYLHLAKQKLNQSPIEIATVINFPDAGEDEIRVERETRRALAAGADEIDLVLPYHALLKGHQDRALKVVKACRTACGAGHVLKLILETGELQTSELIRQACLIGFEGGVDFLKTSTGKVKINATLEAAGVILDSIFEFNQNCGFKVSGGIRTIETALEYVRLTEKKMGKDWVTPNHFRIGASQLFFELKKVLLESHS